MAFSLFGCGEKKLTEEQVLQDVQSESLSDFSTFARRDIVSSEVTGVHRGDDKNTWYADITYCCGIIDEFVTLPIYYTYDKDAGEWTHTFGKGWDIDRTGHACPDACGFWSCSDENVAASFWIDPVTDDTFTLRGLSYTVDSGEYYESLDDDELSGQLVLHFSRDRYKETNGLLSVFGEYNQLGMEQTARIRAQTYTNGADYLIVQLEIVYHEPSDNEAIANAEFFKKLIKRD